MQTEPRFEPTYNLFQHKEIPGLHCAVPENLPVPGFIHAVSWICAGVLRNGDAPPPGFDAAAKLGARLNGFHLYQSSGHAGAIAAIRFGSRHGIDRPSCDLPRGNIDQNHRRPVLRELQSVSAQDRRKAIDRHPGQ